MATASQPLNRGDGARIQNSSTYCRDGTFSLEPNLMPWTMILYVLELKKPADDSGRLMRRGWPLSEPRLRVLKDADCQTHRYEVNSGLLNEMIRSSGGNCVVQNSPHLSRYCAWAPGFEVWHLCLLWSRSAEVFKSISGWHQSIDWELRLGSGLRTEKDNLLFFFFWFSHYYKYHKGRSQSTFVALFF